MKTPVKVGLGLMMAAAAGVAGFASAGAAPGGTGNAGSDAQPVTAAVITQSTPENSFVPLDPCRIVDTRAGGGKLAANSTRGFLVKGTSGFAPQGGKAGGCGVPNSAVSVSVSVTTTISSANNRLVAYPAGGVVPTSTTVSCLKSANVTGSSVVKLASGTGQVMAIHNFNATTHVVVDVVGYYVPPLTAFVGANGTLLYTSGRSIQTVHNATGQYIVTFDRDVSQCGIFAAPSSAPGVTANVSPDSAFAVKVQLITTAQPSAPRDTDFSIDAVC